jgi:hypothetical protein
MRSAGFRATVVRPTVVQWLLACSLALAWPSLAPAADPQATDRVIVKWRADSVASLQIATVGGRALHLRSVTGVDVAPVRTLFGQTDVMQLPYVPSRREMAEILARLNSDPAVQYAEPDAWRYIADFPADPPNDPSFIAGSAAAEFRGNPRGNLGDDCVAKRCSGLPPHRRGRDRHGHHREASGLRLSGRHQRTCEAPVQRRQHRQRLWL